MLKQILFAVLFVCTAGAGVHAHTSMDAQKQFFIDQYKNIAIAEMQRSGIPASIILAQAIIESTWGKSDLARGSNNYFGIKCKSNWLGQKYFHYDDDYDATGNKIKSCFRVYTSIEESFSDHTDFLLNRHYYKDCFNYDSNDYMNWAIALQDAGYATAEDYAYQLASRIDQYALYQYDQAGFSANQQAPSNSILSAPDTRATPVIAQTQEQPTTTYYQAVKEEIVLGNTTASASPIYREPIIANSSYTVEPTPPAVVSLGSAYKPAYIKDKMISRAGIEIEEGQLPTGTYKIATRKEARPIPKANAYTQNNSTYKKHIRPIKYYPKASNNSRR